MKTVKSKIFSLPFLHFADTELFYIGRFTGKRLVVTEIEPRPLADSDRHVDHHHSRSVIKLTQPNQPIKTLVFMPLLGDPFP